MTSPVVIDPARCDFVKKDGKQCGNQAGKGTDHKNFGRCRTHGGNAPTHKVAGARQAIQAMVLDDPQIDAYSVLEGTIRRSWAELLYLQEKVRESDEDDPTGIKAAALWGKLYAEERDRSAKMAKMAIDAGIAERTVRIKEQEGALIAEILRTAFDAMGMTIEQRRKVAPVIRDAMLAAGE